jgi:hypothetical protein
MTQGTDNGVPPAVNGRGTREETLGGRRVVETKRDDCGERERPMRRKEERMGGIGTIVLVWLFIVWAGFAWVLCRAWAKDREDNRDL